MPLYEYQCDSCGHRFERIRKFSDPPIETCPVCSGPVHKLISSPAIQFKGSGWYITDYSKKSSSESAKREAGETGKSSDKSSESKASDSKSSDSKSSDSKSSDASSSASKSEGSKSSGGSDSGSGPAKSSDKG